MVSYIHLCFVNIRFSFVVILNCSGCNYLPQLFKTYQSTEIFTKQTIKIKLIVWTNGDIQHTRVSDLPPPSFPSSPWRHHYSFGSRWETSVTCRAYKLLIDAVCKTPSAYFFTEKVKHSIQLSLMYYTLITYLEIKCKKSKIKSIWKCEALQTIPENQNLLSSADPLLFNMN